MDLQANIDALEAELAALRPSRLPEASDASDASSLDLQEYRRYGRQMILPGFGLPAQLRLKKSKVLVVGAGGLGCPVLLYLASAGVGHITIMDHDTVEISNLHRQVLHTQKRVGMSKVDSAVEAIREWVPPASRENGSCPGRRNSSVVVQPIYRSLSPSVLLSRELDFDSFDLILDCSDNAATRYLLNDACVQHGKVLVSGAAIRLEGQLVVWNLPPAEGQTTRGPCYRCVFPKTGTERASQNCEDEGVLGTVTGTIGTLMAAEAIKLLTGMHRELYRSLRPSRAWIRIRAPADAVLVDGHDSLSHVEDKGQQSQLLGVS
jgi:adenylyltransferase/sulfurtransferase